MNETKKLSCRVVLPNRLGMHARPAAMISKIAAKAEKQVWIGDGETKAEASSVIDILSLGIRQGTRVQICLESEKDIHILEKIKNLIKSGFGEEKDE